MLIIRGTELTIFTVSYFFVADVLPVADLEMHDCARAQEPQGTSIRFSAVASICMNFSLQLLHRAGTRDVSKRSFQPQSLARFRVDRRSWQHRHANRVPTPSSSVMKARMKAAAFISRGHLHILGLRVTKTAAQYQCGAAVSTLLSS